MGLRVEETSWSWTFFVTRKNTASHAMCLLSLSHWLPQCKILLIGSVDHLVDKRWSHCCSKSIGNKGADSQSWAWGWKEKLKLNFCCRQKKHAKSHVMWCCSCSMLSQHWQFASHDNHQSPELLCYIPDAVIDTSFYTFSSNHGLWAVWIEMAVILALCCSLSPHLCWWLSSLISSPSQLSCGISM